MLNPEQVLQHYPLDTFTVKPLAGGIINGTWKVQTAAGTFTLQRVAKIFSPAVMEDISAVTAHLQAHGLRTFDIVKTRTDQLVVPDGECFWRVYTFLPGVVHTQVTDPSIAEAAGALLGRYHLALQDFSYDFQHVRSVKHNIPELYARYVQATEGELSPELQQLAEPIEKLPILAPPPALRKHVTHGDPKIANFIFVESAPMTAFAMIDLDDCGRQYNATIELANAFRSWCQIADDAAENAFSLEIFRAGLQGYVAGAKDFLQPDEWAWLPTALKLLPLELASRFLRDMFEDSYFAWDATRYGSRAEHNLANTKGQLALYQSICKQEQAIQSIIEMVRNSA